MTFCECQWLTENSEIRNRIYAAAVEGEKSFSTLNPAGSNRVDPYLDPYRDCPEKRPVVEKFFKLGRECLGLTHTCRQLRVEFLPIYYRNLEIYIKYWNVYEYLATFIFQGKTDEEPKIKDSELELTCSRDVMSGRDPDTPKTNILPLLRLYKKSPGFVLGFGEEQIYSHGLQSMLDKKNEKWWEYMLEAVSRIHYGGDTYMTSYLEILVKPEFGEGWMDFDRSLLGSERWMDWNDSTRSAHQRYRDERVLWAERYGFGHDCQEFDVGVDRGGHNDEGHWLM
tara:strand:- start:5891 stop:6736 length:846 start_codon:yes stop_codon:yes gene_type:complete